MSPQRHISHRTVKFFVALLILATFVIAYIIFQQRIDEALEFPVDTESMFEPSDTDDDKTVPDLELQQRHFKIKNRNRLRGIDRAGKENRLPNLQTYIIPQVSCPTMVRIGTVDDGGKWVCNPWRIHHSNCVVYSFGVNYDVSFERDLDDVTRHRCKIYCVDPAPKPAQFFTPFNGVFVQGSIGGRSDPSNGIISIMDLKRRFNHTRIDILKMDIESSEFESLDGFFKEAKINESQSNVCQLLVEFHFTNGRLETWTEMFVQIERLGFRMFSKEPNAYCQRCYEFSYIHLSCFKMYGLSKSSVLFTLS